MGGTVPCACCTGEDPIFEVPPYETAGPKSVLKSAPSRSIAPEPKLPHAVLDKPVTAMTNVVQDEPGNIPKVHSDSSTRDTSNDSRGLEDSRDRREAGLTSKPSEHGLADKVVQAMRQAELGRLADDAKAWCSQRGVSTLGELRDQFDEFCTDLQLPPAAQHSVRVALDLPPPHIGLMSLRDVGIELALDADEFAGYVSMVCKMQGKPSVRDIAQYLTLQGVLLTAPQAKQIFEVLLPRTTGSNCPYSVQSQLVMALHCFCVEPYALWEDDGCNSDMWRKMTFEGVNLWDTGLCEDLDRKLCTDSGRKVTQREENLRRDISGIRFALETLRGDGKRDRRLALKQLVKPKFQGIYGDRY